MIFNKYIRFFSSEAEYEPGRLNVLKIAVPAKPSFGPFGSF